eukprot:m.91628 g.91628  ORF g.91628 m.91628 type:complete len:362 (-) comp12953_c0_seq4:280-1365(-)
MSRATCMCHMSTNQIHIPQYARFCCSYVTRCCSCASTLSLSINTGMNAVRGMLYVGLGANIALGVHTLNHPRSTASEMILQRVPVPKDIVNKVYRFASHMGLRYPDHLAIVTSNSMSAFSGGSTVGQEGALVALPPTHIASSVDDRLLKGVIVKGRPLNASAPEDKDLVELVFPTDEQVDFTICHELAHLAQHHMELKTVTQPLLIALGFEAWYNLHHRRGTSTAFKLLVPSIIAATLFGLHIAFNWAYELQADVVAAQVSQSVCEGGLVSLSKRARVLGNNQEPYQYPGSAEIAKACPHCQDVSQDCDSHGPDWPYKWLLHSEQVPMQLGATRTHPPLALRLSMLEQMKRRFYTQNTAST